MFLPIYDIMASQDSATFEKPCVNSAKHFYYDCGTAKGCFDTKDYDKSKGKATIPKVSMSMRGGETNADATL